MTSAATPAASVEVPRVVVVGGDPADCAVIGSIAKAYGMELSVFDRPDLDVDALSRLEPDAIIVDVSQPGTSGFEICTRLRAHPATRAVPVVLTSTVDTVEARRQADEVGADDYLVKPIARTQLAYRLRSFTRLRRRWANDDTTERFLTTLARLADARSRGHGHQHDVLRASCDDFAVHLGLDPAARKALHLAAELHDIGEIAIPSEILRQPSPLSTADRALIEQHPEVGAAMIEQLPGCGALAEVIRHHHERWDGTGYPDRLAGADIPYLARVFHLLDVFDALTQPRPYQAMRSATEAIEIMVASPGSFDPTLLIAFVAWRSREQAK